MRYTKLNKKAGLTWQVIALIILILVMILVAIAIMYKTGKQSFSLINFISRIFGE